MRLTFNCPHCDYHTTSTENRPRCPKCNALGEWQADDMQVEQVLRNRIQLLEAALMECRTDVASTGDITCLRRRLLDINAIATQAIRAPLDVPFSARG